ncbi:MAG: imelysin family protein, partial [Myxococcota bacterium]
PTIQAPIDRLVNDFVYWAERLEQMNLAAPLGKKSGGQKLMPELLESRWAEYSKELLLANIQGLRALYTCSLEDKKGNALFHNQVDRGFEQLANQILSQLQQIERELQSWSFSMRQGLAQRPEKIEALYQLLKSLKQRLATELTSALGTVLNFTDNDGD